MEMFSGIPVKALLENDKKTTKLDLGNSGCGDTEALVLAECLKVVELFVFLGIFRVALIFFLFLGTFRVVLVTGPPPVTHFFWLFWVLR